VSVASRVLLIVLGHIGAFLHSAVCILTDSRSSQCRGCVPVFSVIFRNSLLCVGERQATTVVSVVPLGEKVAVIWMTRESRVHFLAVTEMLFSL
jgi:hypothetical protein